MSSTDGRLGREFFAQSPLEIAPQLLGCLLRFIDGGERVSLRIVEVEAYLGIGEDPASHAFRKKTSRNSQMFETPGSLYVYFTYGMHHCMNFVCREEGIASAVLLRAAEVLEGEDLLQKRRSKTGPNLSNGPAKICQALGVDLSWNGCDLLQGDLGIWPGDSQLSFKTSGRIGIKEARRRAWRFYDPESLCLSI